MTTNYPTGLDTYTTRTDGVDNIVAADHNNHSDAIVALETELGFDPSNTSGTAPNYADVATRLNAFQTSITLNTIIGVDIYRAATTNANTGTGVRTLTGYDTTRVADAAFTVSLAAGTITVPTTGWYHAAGHCRFTTAVSDTIFLHITDGTNELVRSTSIAGTTTSVGTSGFCYVTAGTALRLSLATTISASPQGNTAGSYYYFRVVRC